MNPNRVRCAGRYFDADLASNDPSQLADALHAARASIGHAECLCVTPPRRLVIRERAGRCWLAVWPLDGHRHALSCPFHREELGEEDRSDGSKPAVVDLGDGQVDIRLDFSLARPRNSTGAPPKVISPSGDAQIPRPSRSRMPMLGLLQYVWAAGSLNRWGKGWRRDYWRVRQQLLNAASDIIVGGHPLSDLVYMPPEFRASKKDAADRDWASYRGALFSSLDQDSIKSGIVVGELRELAPAKFGFRLALRHLADWFYLSEQLHQQLLRKYVRAMTHKRVDGDQVTRVIVLAQIESTPGGSLRVMDAALMVTSRDYIPVDSMYEAKVANLLVDESRSFFKPMRRETEDRTLPDFVLTDTRPETVMEVFGMDTVQYLQAKELKLRHYEEQGTALWQWDAAAGVRMPAFPAPAWAGSAAV